MVIYSGLTFLDCELFFFVLIQASVVNELVDGMRQINLVLPESMSESSSISLRLSSHVYSLNAYLISHYVY